MELSNFKTSSLIRAHARVHACVHACSACTRTHACAHARTHIGAHARARAHTHTHTHWNTHTHTPPHFSVIRLHSHSSTLSLCLCRARVRRHTPYSEQPATWLQAPPPQGAHQAKASVRAALPRPHAPPAPAVGAGRACATAPHVVLPFVLTLDPCCVCESVWRGGGCIGSGREQRKGLIK